MTAAKGNGIDPVVLKRWTGEVLAIHDKLDDQKIANLNECKRIREPLPDLYEAAKNAGLPIKAFKAHIRIELAQRKFNAAVEKATPEDDEDLEAFEALRAVAEAGDLFDHAVKKHDEGDDVRPEFLKQQERDRAAAKKNAKALKVGALHGLPGAKAAEA